MGLHIFDTPVKSYRGPMVLVEKLPLPGKYAINHQILRGTYLDLGGSFVVLKKVLDSLGCREARAILIAIKIAMKFATAIFAIILQF